MKNEIILEQGTSNMKKSCVYGYFMLENSSNKKQNDDNSENWPSETNEWVAKPSQIQVIDGNKNVVVYLKDGTFTTRESYQNIGTKVDGPKKQGKWYCDGLKNFIVQFDNGNILSTKLRTLLKPDDEKYDEYLAKIKEENGGKTNDKTKSEDTPKEKDDSNQTWKRNEVDMLTKTFGNQVGGDNKLGGKVFLVDDQNHVFYSNHRVHKVDTGEKNNWKLTSSGVMIGDKSYDIPKEKNDPPKKSKPKVSPLKPSEYSGVEFEYRYPHDKAYEYGVKDGKWLARNLKNKKVFDITVFETSVKKLNKEYPNALTKKSEETKTQNDGKPNVRVNTNESKITNKSKVGDTYKRVKDMKNVIKESLVEMSNKKRIETIQESKIVKNRFSVLIEGKKSFTKTETEEFFIDLINEIRLANSTGINTEVIKEELLKLLTTLSNTDDKSIMEMFREKYAKWLSDKLVKNDVVMSSDVYSSIIGIDVNDTTKLIECDFTSEIITKTVITNFKQQMEINDTNPTNVNDMMKESLIKIVDDSSFFMKLKGRIEKVLCPILNNIEDKMDSASDEIRKKIVES